MSILSLNIDDMIYENIPKSKIIDLNKNYEEMVSASELLEILEKQSLEVDSINFNPPLLGESGFGDFVVSWKTPRYEVSL